MLIVTDSKNVPADGVKTGVLTCSINRKVALLIAESPIPSRVAKALIVVLPSVLSMKGRVYIVESLVGADESIV